MQKIVVTDVDGTLLDAKNQLSEFTLEVLHALVAKGVHIVLASSRGHENMKTFYDQIGSESPMICYNGTFSVEDPHQMPSFITYEEVFYKPMNEIVELCSGLLVQYCFYSIHDWYAPRMDKWVKQEAEVLGTKPVIFNKEEFFYDWKKCLMHPIFKMTCMGEKEAIDKLYEKTAVYGELYHRYRTGDHHLELVSRRSDKWLAFEEAADFLDIDPKDSIAFGDGYNDIRLLSEAGVSVAVANARPELYEIADFYTARHDEDGVAKFLQKHYKL